MRKSFCSKEKSGKRFAGQDKKSLSTTTPTTMPPTTPTRTPKTYARTPLLLVFCWLRCRRNYWRRERKKTQKKFLVGLDKVRKSFLGSGHTENTDLAIKKSPRLVQNKTVNRGCNLQRWMKNHSKDSKVKINLGGPKPTIWTIKGRFIRPEAPSLLPR